MMTFVEKVIETAIEGYEKMNKFLNVKDSMIFMHEFPMSSDYILFKLNEELEKATDKNVIKQLKKEIYGFEHLEAKTFALNHPEITEEEYFSDLVENCEYSKEEAELVVEQVRTYRNL